MFTYVKLKNFKSFVRAEIDFRNKKKDPKNLICIYGENGAGKSNIASVFHVLKEFVSTREWVDNLKEVMDAVSKENDDVKSNMLLKIMKDRFRDVETIINKSKTINSDGNMCLEFGIQLDIGKGYYYIETDNTSIVKEKLSFTLKEREGVYFEIDKTNINNPKLNKSVFYDSVYLKELKEEIKKYWGKYSLLSILAYEMHEKNIDYITENINVKLIKILLFIEKVSTSFKVGNHSERGFFSNSYEILCSIDKGEIGKSELPQLEAVERFVREFFCTLYSDIKDVAYNIKEKENEKIEYTLVFKKLIDGKIININYDLESTGTMKLLNILPYLLAYATGNTVIIDEIDSGIHDILFRNLVENLQELIKGQLIITTHNTYIMESALENENIYFIDIDEIGNKSIRCLDDYDIRTRKHNNARLKYLKGLYGGIPNSDYFDFEEMYEELFDTLEEMDFDNEV